MLQFWIDFWTWLLVIAVALFAGLAVVVIIGGFFDIRAMLRRIAQQHEDADAEGNSTGSTGKAV